MRRLISTGGLVLTAMLSSQIQNAATQPRVTTEAKLLWEFDAGG